MSQAEIFSFGYLHGAPPPAHVTVDVRDHFRDPHADPSLRGLTGKDPEIINHVIMHTRGAWVLAKAIAAHAAVFVNSMPGIPVTVAIGCAGGRHRSVVIADEVAAMLTRDGIPASVHHRDIAEPVVERRRANGRLR